MPPLDNDPAHRDAARILLGSIAGWTLAVLPAMASVVPVRYFHCSNRSAAWIVLGIFGGAGGVSYAIAAQAAGVPMLRKQRLLLAMVWSACCIGGVTPLFLTLAVPMKMALLAFYSFGLFGALGGYASGRILDSGRGLFRNGDNRFVLVWGVSFGAAAFSVNAVSFLFEFVLPQASARVLSFAFMAVLIGGGAGYSLLLLRTSAEGSRNQPDRIDPLPGPESSNGFRFSAMVLLVLPFYFNDAANLWVQDWRWWLCIDYAAARLFPLFLVIRLVRAGKIHRDHLGLMRLPAASFLTVFFIGTLAGALILENGHLFLGMFAGYHRLGRIPIIESMPWKWIDLTIGLLLVGICEELVFRGCLYAFLRRYTGNLLIITGLSAVLFGFIHWSEGFHQVMVTGAIGAVFMMLYAASRSLPAVMLAHVTVNFIHSAGIVPNAWFRYV